MPFLAVVLIAIGLYKVHPAWFAWNATGGRTLLIFTIIIVVLVCIPRTGHRD